MSSPVRPPNGHKLRLKQEGFSVSCVCGWAVDHWGENPRGRCYADLRKHWIECGANFDASKVRPNGTLINK